MAAHPTGPCRIRTRLNASCRVLFVVAGCLLPVGCGKEGHQLAPVSGRVTLDGKPLADVRVSFQPVAKRPDEPNPGPGSYGSTDADGRYSLRTVDRNAEGAVVGTHKVYVRTKPPAQDPADDRAPVFKEIVPPKWYDGSQTLEVPPAGTDQANFNMSSR